MHRVGTLVMTIALALLAPAPAAVHSQSGVQPTVPRPTPAGPTASWQILAQGAELRSPMGVAVDGAGTVYVADAGNHRVVRLGPEGRVAGVWGSQGARPGQFDDPSGIAVDWEGYVYVADTFNHRVQKLTPDGQPLLVVGEAGTGPGQFRDPHGVAVDPYGQVYVADTHNNRVQKLTSEGEILPDWGAPDVGDGAPIAGRGRPTGTFRQPKGIAADAYGRLVVADTNNVRVVTLSAETGQLLDTWLTLGGGRTVDSASGGPRGVAADAYGRVYVADTYNHRVELLDADGTPLARWGAEGGAPGEFRFPAGVALDAAGTLYVADTGNHRIQRLVTRGG